MILRQALEEVRRATLAKHDLLKQQARPEPAAGQHAVARIGQPSSGAKAPQCESDRITA